MSKNYPLGGISMKIQDILKNCDKKTILHKNNWQSVCKLSDRRLVDGKQVKRSQIQIP